MLSTIQTELLELIRKAQSYRELVKLTSKPELREALTSLPTDALRSIRWWTTHASG